MSLIENLETKTKKVLALFEKDGKQVATVVTLIDNGCTLVGKLLVQGKAIEPEVKEQLTDLISKGEAVATAITAVTISSGANWTADAEAVAAVEAFVPVMISTLKVLKADAEEFLPEIESITGTASNAPADTVPSPALKPLPVAQ